MARVPASGGTTGAGGTGTGGTTGSGAGATGSGGAARRDNPGKRCTPPAAYGNLFVSVSGHTQADSDTKVAAAWSALFNPAGSGAIYHNGPGTDESYVEDTYNNDVRTEGMSYGMMIALQLNHQAEFDRMWTFVKNHMAQGDNGQMAWHGVDLVAPSSRPAERRTATSTSRPRSSSPTTVGATRPESTTTGPRPSGCST